MQSMYKYETLLMMLIVVLSTQLQINRLRITYSKGTPLCSLKLVNTHQIIDLRTDCNISLAKNGQIDNTLLKFIKFNATYLIKQNKTIRGYRYFKDPHNYKFKEYDFDAYHQALQKTLNDLKLSEVPLPFVDNYELTLGWDESKNIWILSELFVSYQSSPVKQLTNLEGYQVKSWFEASAGEKSIALRKLGGIGPNQAVNITLDLSLQDDSKINLNQCQVVIQQILPQWFFVDYDCLHTLVKYEVFDIELPEHFAKQYFFKYTVPMSRFTKTGLHSYHYQYKIGVRYPRPTNDDTYYVHVGLQPNDRITVQCQGRETFEVKQDLLNDRGHGTMFAGRAQDTKRVTMVTFLVMIVLSVVAVKSVRVPKEEN